jgi:hypothetical protein
MRETSNRKPLKFRSEMPPGLDWWGGEKNMGVVLHFRIFVLSVLMGFLFLSLLPVPVMGQWQRIGENVDLVVVGYDQIEGQNLVYATKRTDGSVYQYNNIPLSWTEIGKNYQWRPNAPLDQPLKMLAFGGHGLFGLYSAQVWNYTGKPGAWGWYPSGPWGAIYGGQGGLYAAIYGEGTIFNYDYDRAKKTGLLWALIGKEPAKMLAVGSDEYHLYRLAADGSGVWWFDRAKYGWAMIGGPAKEIYAGGTQLFATNPNTGNIYRYNGKPFSWTQIGGPGKMFAVDYQGRLYGLSPDGRGVYQFSGTPMKWKQIGGPAGSIHAGGNQARVYATNPQTHDLWTLFLP